MFTHTEHFKLLVRVLRCPTAMDVQRTSASLNVDSTMRKTRRSAARLRPVGRGPRCRVRVLIRVCSVVRLCIGGEGGLIGICRRGL